jgi:hypothetical protein
MKRNVKSKMLAAALMLGAATPLTLSASILTSTAAEAGVLSKVKSAAKKVGGAAKSTAKGFVAAGKAAGAVGRQVGVGVGGTVKRAAVAVGHQAAKLPPVKGVINAGRAVKQAL